MSRIGKRIIKIPENVEINFSNDFKKITVNGPLGILKKNLSGKIKIKIENNELTTNLSENFKKKDYPLWGTTNSLIKNFIDGVTVGYKKQLIVSGLGYKVFLKGNTLEMNLGFSDTKIFKFPEEIKIEVEKNTLITVSGIDKEIVGLISSKIKKIRKIEPYKGKGIAYVGEKIKRKVGKTASG